MQSCPAAQHSHDAGTRQETHAEVCRGEPCCNLSPSLRRCMLLGRPEGLSPEAATAMMERVSACMESSTGTPIGSASVELLATLLQGSDCLDDAAMASGVRQLLTAAGAQLDASREQSLATELRWNCLLFDLPI